jgi:hypothetical protein
MKRLLLLLFLLLFPVCAHAADYTSLSTHYSEGGNQSDKFCIIGSGQVHIGPCRVLSINFFSSTAGDLVGIYDTTAVGYQITDLEYELGISANNTNAPSIYPNAPFVNGVKVLSTNANSLTTFVFDY